MVSYLCLISIISVWLICTLNSVSKSYHLVDNDSYGLLFFQDFALEKHMCCAFVIFPLRKISHYVARCLATVPSCCNMLLLLNQYIHNIYSQYRAFL